MSTDDATPDTPRYVITGGGTPSAEQLAALAVAMTPVVVEDADTPTGPPGGNWQAAAIREGVGHRTFVALPDLQAGRFPLG